MGATTPPQPDKQSENKRDGEANSREQIPQNYFPAHKNARAVCTLNFGRASLSFSHAARVSESPFTMQLKWVLCVCILQSASPVRVRKTTLHLAQLSGDRRLMVCRI